MAVLKAFNCVDSDVQEFCEPRLAYLKSEADRELNRQKYLRCESLIKVCMGRSQTWMCRYSYAETEVHRQVCFDFAIHYNQRAEVLRKLAEKLKEEP